jgi:hypothetical protein
MYMQPKEPEEIPFIHFDRIYMAMYNAGWLKPGVPGVTTAAAEALEGNSWLGGSPYMKPYHIGSPPKAGSFLTGQL